MIGKIIGGCKIEAELGRGGMGIVYRAVQLSLDRPVALKIFDSSVSSDKEFVERFLLEAKSVAKLIHPNIVQVHDAGHEDQLYYIVMELVEGSSLEDLQNQKKLKIDTTSIFIDAVNGIAHAHKNGIMHRDIKPGNIMITKNNHAKIMDFGLAKIISNTEETQDIRLTQSGRIVGTPAYMSPEQCQDDELTSSTDIYSLGATFYHILTGTMPFTADSVIKIMMKHVSSPLTPAINISHNVSVKMSGILSKCLAKTPSERYADAEELLEALESLKISINKKTVETPILSTKNTKANKEKKAIGGGEWLLLLVAIICSGTYLLYSQSKKVVTSFQAEPHSATQTQNATTTQKNEAIINDALLYEPTPTQSVDKSKEETKEEEKEIAPVPKYYRIEYLEGKNQIRAVEARVIKRTYSKVKIEFLAGGERTLKADIILDEIPLSEEYVKQALFERQLAEEEEAILLQEKQSSRMMHSTRKPIKGTAGEINFYVPSAWNFAEKQGNILRYTAPSENAEQAELQVTTIQYESDLDSLVKAYLEQTAKGAKILSTDTINANGYTATQVRLLMKVETPHGKRTQSLHLIFVDTASSKKVLFQFAFSATPSTKTEEAIHHIVKSFRVKNK